MEALNKLNCPGKEDCQKCPIGERNLWKELLPLWITLMVVSLIVLFFAGRYLVKDKNQADSDDIVKGKSVANPVIAFRGDHKKEQEMNSL